MYFVDEYVRLFRSVEKLEPPEQHLPVCGRIVKGKLNEPKNFETLSTHKEDRSCFALGPDGMHKLLELKLKLWDSPPEQLFIELLKFIGLTRAYIKEKLAQGFIFELLVFPVFTSPNSKFGSIFRAYHATWDGIADFVDFAFPVASLAVKKHLSALKTTPFEEIQCAAPIDMHTVHLSGYSDPDYLHYDKLCAILKERDVVLWEIRAFLHFEMGLMKLFAGNGYIMGEDCSLGPQEYIIPNVPRALIEGLFHAIQLQNMQPQIDQLEQWLL